MDAKFMGDSLGFDVNIEQNFHIYPRQSQSAH